MLEADAWVAYYRRDWLRFARAGVTVARRSFGLSWPATLASAWLVLRANQLWAPYPGNHPQRAQRAMERFFRIARRTSGEPFDPAVAAALEVQWWRVHRDKQHTSMADDERALTAAIAALYAYVYSVPPHSVYAAAAQRALAMSCTDKWVAAGCTPGSPLIDAARDALISSYTALLAAVGTPHTARQDAAPAHGRRPRRRGRVMPKATGPVSAIAK